MSATQSDVKDVQSLLAFLSYAEVHEDGQKQAHQICEAVLKKYKEMVKLLLTVDSNCDKEMWTFQYSGQTFKLKDDFPNWASLLKLLQESKDGLNRLLYTTGTMHALCSGEFTIGTPP
jgi:hypothetical protein